jgi:hypothetical protein
MNARAKLALGDALGDVSSMRSYSLKHEMISLLSLISSVTQG